MTPKRNKDRYLVTILMPCKDSKISFLNKALDSVLNQSCSCWNLVVIDDHSASVEIVDFFRDLNKSNDDRISVIENKSNLITGALNTGMRYAKSPYVCSLHSDDLLDVRAIEILNRYIKDSPDVDYFHSSRMHIDENGDPIGPVLKSRKTFNVSDFINYGPVKHLHCWKVASALKIGGMDESLGLHGADDYDFPWCMAEAGYSFKAITECLYYYRDHREHYRLTTHVPLNAQIMESKKIWRKHSVTEKEIEKQIKRRTSSYLKQALYLDDQDKERKDRDNYDIRLGWREKV